MAIRKQFVDIELTDGTTVEDARVFWADKVAAERTLAARGWDIETSNMLLTGLIAWNVAKRSGATALGWEEFEKQLVDASLSIDDEEPSGEDPTPAA